MKMPRSFLHTLRGYQKKEYCEANGFGGMNIMVTRSGLTIKTIPQKVKRSQSRELTAADSPPMVQPSSRLASPEKRFKPVKNGNSWGNVSIITRYELILSGMDVDFCGYAGSPEKMDESMDDRPPMFVHIDKGLEELRCNMSTEYCNLSPAATATQTDVMTSCGLNEQGVDTQNDAYSFCCSGSRAVYEKCALDGLENLTLLNFCPPLEDWSKEFIQMYLGRDDSLGKDCDGDCKDTEEGEGVTDTLQKKAEPNMNRPLGKDIISSLRENKRKSSKSHSPQKRKNVGADICVGESGTTCVQNEEFKGKETSPSYIREKGHPVVKSAAVMSGLQKATSWLLTQSIKPNICLGSMSPAEANLRSCERREGDAPTSNNSFEANLLSVLPNVPSPGKFCVNSTGSLVGSPMSMNSGVPMSPARSTASSQDSDDSQLKMEIMGSIFEMDGKRTYKCQECARIFLAYSAIKSHLLTHDSKTNLCPVCGRAFARNWLLQGHMRTHTGEKPFPCSYPGCKKAFADKSNLRAHILIHTTKSKDYICKACDRAFAQKRYLHKHQLDTCPRIAKETN